MKSLSRFSRIAGILLAVCLTVSAVLMCISFSAKAETGEGSAADKAPAAETARTVTVVGNGSVFDTPDRADITFSIRTEDTTAKAAQEKNTETVDAVYEKLEELGVEEKNIKTRGYDLYPVYDYSSNVEKITGYMVTTRIAVTDRTIEETGALLSEIVAAGANGIDSVSYSCSKYEEDYGEALAKAVAGARVKAAALAAAAGKELGDVVTIAEGYQDMTYRSAASTASYNKAMFDSVTEEAADAGYGMVPVMPGEAEITAQVTITYELK